MEQVNLFSIVGSRQKLDGGAMFGNAPKPLWEQWIPADGRNRISLACRSLLVQIGKLNILLETGIGAFFDPKLQERFGVEKPDVSLIEQLKRYNLVENDIHYVILSHLHFDHAGGLIPDWPAITTDNWMPRFPQATYLVGQEHFNRALNPHPRDRASFIPGLCQKLEKTGRLLLVEDAENQGYCHRFGLAPLEGYVSFFFSQGHTPGQMHAIIKGVHQEIIFAGDLIPGTPWVHIPVSMGYDRFSEKLIDEKAWILPQIVAKEQLLFYTHDPQVAASRVLMNDEGKYQAFAEIAVLVNYEL